MKFFEIILKNKKLSIKQYFYFCKKKNFKDFIILIKDFPPFDEKLYLKDDDDYTKKCIHLLINNQSIDEKLLLEDRAGNIFCPLHENFQTSKSPSGKLLVKRNQYICFSSNCPILPNSKNNKIISTKQLYFKILQKNQRQII